MGEKSRFQNDVEIVAKALEQQAREEEPRMEASRLYRKFKQTKREPVRLAVALRAYFMEAGVSPDQREKYGDYLREKVCPAMEELIAEEAVEKMKAFEQQGWFGARELEEFIRSARTRGKSASLVWLLHVKNEKYGYQDYDFAL